jgi:hypothetical protein
VSEASHRFLVIRNLTRVEASLSEIDWTCAIPRYAHLLRYASSKLLLDTAVHHLDVVVHGLFSSISALHLYAGPLRLTGRVNHRCI